METTNKMIDTLQHKPIIGIVGGFSGTFFAGMRAFITDDKVLGAISIFGIWIGFFIALLTLIIKLAELYRLVRTWFKKK